MHFTLSAGTAVLAMASSAVAQAEPLARASLPVAGYKATAGSTMEIAWTCPESKRGQGIQLVLVGGASQDFQEPIGAPITTVPCNPAGNSYQYLVPNIPQTKVNGIKFVDAANANNIQWSSPFQIVGGSASQSSSSKSATSAAPSSETAPYPTAGGAGKAAVPTGAAAPAPASPSSAYAPAPVAAGVNGAVAPAGVAAPTGIITGSNNTSVLTGAASMAQASLLAVGGVVALALAL